MSSQLPQNQSLFLEPGYIYCSRGPVNLSAVLGSCVAVCVWDQYLKFGGMNHFLFPSTTDPDKATPQYGNVATVQLINMMESAGSKKRNLLAQILGGASPANTDGHALGIQNVESARTVLRRKGIKICSEDIGGHMGRKVIFDSHTGHVMVLKVYKIRQEDWLTYDSR